MTQLTDRSFGLLIAYVIPGLTVLGGLSPHSTLIARWLGAAPTATPTVGGFLFLTVASVAAGLLMSTLRWLVLDPLHHRTGIAAPRWDFTQLQANVDAFELAVVFHYRYYQFYGNTLAALVMVVIADWPMAQLLPMLPWQRRVGEIFIALLLFVASRDALHKYYARTNVLIHSPCFDKETVDESHDQRLAPPSRHRPGSASSAADRGEGGSGQ